MDTLVLHIQHIPKPVAQVTPEGVPPRSVHSASV